MTFGVVQTVVVAAAAPVAVVDQGKKPCNI
jgi:hypothetical protein